MTTLEKITHYIKIAILAYEIYKNYSKIAPGWIRSLNLLILMWDFNTLNHNIMGWSGGYNPEACLNDSMVMINLKS